LIKNAENKAKLLTNLRAIEKHFQFRTGFYKNAEITPSPENDQLIDNYQKIRGISGERAGLIYNNG